MLEPLPTPSPQFCDANGVPYAGGTVTTYVPGTSTLANTWSNLEGTALNTNPIVLDAAGRALIYGAGDYRFVLKDANGNLIWDQETSALDKTSLVTMAQVNTAVQTETNRATAAESTLTTSVNNETTRATNAENSLSSNITSVAASLGPAGTFFQGGLASTDATGHVRLTFPTAYHNNPIVLIQIVGTTYTQIDAMVGYSSTTGIDVYTSSGGAGLGVGFAWFAWGN